jgi:hypothetical protein
LRQGDCFAAFCDTERLVPRLPLAMTSEGENGYPIPILLVLFILFLSFLSAFFRVFRGQFLCIHRERPPSMTMAVPVM